MPLWDLQELHQNPGEANLSLDCSVDLKLGSLGAFKWAENLKKRRTSTAAASSSKRPRVLISGNQNVLCLVDDCKSDLSECREYHRRHKVCELHSKTPIVMVGGREQRFCQQCSRFHLLVEFDTVKRSCRKRLDGHNRRRRKPQPEPVNAKSLFTSHGLRLITHPSHFTSTSTDSTWINMTKIEERACYVRQYSRELHFTDRIQYFFPAASRSFEQGKQFPLFEDGGKIAFNSRMTKEKSLVCHPLLYYLFREQ